MLVPQENEAEEDRKPERQGRIKALASEIAQDPRPFQEFPPEERSVRLRKVMGIGLGLMSTSEEFAKRKDEEIEFEEPKFGR